MILPRHSCSRCCNFMTFCITSECSPTFWSYIFSHITYHTPIKASARGLVVMIDACQVLDPGSIPGERNCFTSISNFRTFTIPIPVRTILMKCYVLESCPHTSYNAFCKSSPRVRLELTTYRLTAGRATDCAIQDLALNARQAV